MHKHTGQSKCPYLHRDALRLVRAATAAHFAVDAPCAMRFRFRDAGWTDVPYLIRYECTLKPRDFNAGPEMLMRVTRSMNPAFARESLFLDSDVSLQETLVAQYKEITIPSICAVSVARRTHCDTHKYGCPAYRGMACTRQPGASDCSHYLECVTRVNGVTKVCKLPCWCAIETGVLDTLRQKLKSCFCIDTN